MIQLGYNTLWILCWVADGSDGLLTDTPIFLEG